jgi:hypothetical protein
MAHQLDVVIEQDVAGYFVASVPVGHGYRVNKLPNIKGNCCVLPRQFFFVLWDLTYERNWPRVR